MEKNLSKREYEVMSELAFRGLKSITLPEASELLDIRKGYLRVIFHRLEKKKWLERIERGKYIVVPMEGKLGWSEHPFLTAARMVTNYYISYRTALAYHGLSEQIPQRIYVATLDRKARMERAVQGYVFRFIRIKPGKFFGYKKEKIEREEVNIAEIEKAIIDCLDKEQYAGTIIETAKAIGNRNMNVDKMKRYAKRMENSSLIRRLGYLLELFNLDSNGLEKYIGSYREVYLSTKLPKHCMERDKKWKLIINVRTEDLLEW